MVFYKFYMYFFLCYNFMTELLGCHCNYVVETTNVSLEDKLFESPNVKV